MEQLGMSEKICERCDAPASKRKLLDLGDVVLCEKCVRREISENDEAARDNGFCVDEE